MNSRPTSSHACAEKERETLCEFNVTHLRPAFYLLSVALKALFLCQGPQNVIWGPAVIRSAVEPRNMMQIAFES